MSGSVTGGCQCGAVRYRIERVDAPGICHCRMCQKALGNFFGPFGGAVGLEWTRGERTLFQSSNKVARGFCNQCGTPLTFEGPNGIEITLGSLDEPHRAPPETQINLLSKLAFCDSLASLPTRRAEEDWAAEAAQDPLISYQHPDHDTAEWPRAEKP